MSDQANPAIRFLRFEWEYYYPGGAQYDLCGAYATLNEATEKLPFRDNSWVLDTWTGKSYSPSADHRRQNEDWTEDAELVKPGLR